jgi:general nucleoside transport system permease protein
VVNIAIEGMMLTGAMVSVVAASIFRNYDASHPVTGDPLFPAWLATIGRTLDQYNISEALPWYLLLGLVAGMLSGALLAAFHAWLSINFKVDQIISGTVINIFAVGITSFLSQRFLQPIQPLNSGSTFKILPIPGLSSIPVIGPLLFENRPIIYLLFILVIAIHIMLFYTRWGLRTIAVGEHPKAADTLGVNVFKVRYINVIMGGMVAGLGGAYFTIGSVGRFDEVMTAGKGFIGLAAMIFGKWTPFGAFGASLIFGFADALQVKLQGLGTDQVPIPSEFLLMAPYLVTMIVLAGAIGQAIPPAADGKPYEKD